MIYKASCFTVFKANLLKLFYGHYLHSLSQKEDLYCMGSYTDLFHRHMHRVLGLLLLIMTISVYWQVQQHDFIRFDDPYYVTQNRHVQDGLTKRSLVWALSSFHASNWHPLTWFSHMLDFQLYGLNPAGHHLFSLFLHIANTLLLFLLLRESTNQLWRSFLVAGLFALHPLHVESVAWISERKDVLSTFFWMFTMLAYVRYAKKPGMACYLFTLLLFALGLLAKPMLVTLPFVLILFDYWPLGRLHIWKSPVEKDRETVSFACIFWEKIPFFALSAASSIVTYIAQSQGGAIQPLRTYTIASRLFNAVVSYVRYIYKMIWPQDLAIFYPHPGTTLEWLPGLAASLFLVVFSIAVCRRAGRYPYLLTGWFWFLGTLVPVIGLIRVGMQAMADRYTYVPHIGLFIILVWGLSDFFKKQNVNRKLTALFWGIIISVLMALTWFQLQHWQNTLTLFQHALNVTRDNYAAHYIIARAHGARGNMDRAFFHYNRAVEISPVFVSMMHNRFGYHLFKQGQIEEAMVQFSGALEIEPDYANAHNNLGAILARKGQLDEAIRHFSEALKIQPDYSRARKNLQHAQPKKK